MAVVAPETPRLLAADGTPVLSVRRLRKERKRADCRFVLEVPTLDLRAGQFIAVVGDSGCGKSTLLDMLALVLRPTDCDGFHLTDDDGTAIDIWRLWRRNAEDGLAALRRRRFGYILQTGGLLPFLTVEENIRLPSRLIGAPLGRDEVRRLAERVGIDGVLALKPQYLSGGQRQRAAVLRALAHGPGIVLADEPTAAVDKPRAAAIVADLHALAREHGAVVVMVTHDMGLVRPHADRTLGFSVTRVTAGDIRSVCRFRP